MIAMRVIGFRVAEVEREGTANKVTNLLPTTFGDHVASPAV